VSAKGASFPIKLKALTRRAACHNRNIVGTDTRAGSDVVAVYFCNAATDTCAIRKVELVNGTVDRIVLDRRTDIEARLKA